jgi:hypothetical protein
MTAARVAPRAGITFIPVRFHDLIPYLPEGRGTSPPATITSFGNVALFGETVYAYGGNERKEDRADDDGRPRSASFTRMRSSGHQ